MPYLFRWLCHFYLSNGQKITRCFCLALALRKKSYHPLCSCLYAPNPSKNQAQLRNVISCPFLVLRRWRWKFAGFLLVVFTCLPLLTQAQSKTQWDCQPDLSTRGWVCGTQQEPEKTRPVPVTSVAPNPPTPIPVLDTESNPPVARTAQPAKPPGISLQPTIADPSGSWSMCNNAQATPIVTLKTEDRASGSLQLDADELEQTENQMTFLGHVEARRADQFLRADKAIYQSKERTITAEGGVYYQEKNLALSADRAFLELDTNKGKLDQVEYQLPQRHARGTAVQVELLDKDRGQFRQISYTTCDPGNRDWELRASQLSVDTASGIGSAHHAWLSFKRLPFFYFPYLRFPIDDRRVSGFLLPKIGQSDNTGIDISLPYYWNIAPNMDATFTPRVMSKRGLLLGSEFRYLYSSGAGELLAEYLPEDSSFNDDRTALSFEHQGQFGSRIGSYVVANYASDEEYFEDLGNSLDVSSTRLLERRADLIYFGDFWSLLGRVQYHQVLDRRIAQVNRPYQRLPQVAFEMVLPESFLGLQYELNGEYVYFDRTDSVVGSRVDLNPAISLPLRSRWGFLQPRLGLRYTAYTLDDQTAGLPDDPDRGLATFSLDSGLIFERATGWDGLVQTLEPRLFYLYIPKEDQDQLPVFDSTELDFSFAQLFRENRFSGVDRIGDANQLTLALSTRLLDQHTGQERLRLALGQILFFKDQEVVLPGQPAQTDSSSDLVGELATNIGAWELRMGAQWDPNSSRTAKSNAQIRYQRDSKHLFNLDYRLRRDELEQTDFSLSWPLARSWQLVGRWNYSLLENLTLEGLAGLEYESCCWAFRTLLRRYVDDADSEPNTSVLLQLELKGLGNFGDTIGQQLEQRILGYTRRRIP